MIRLSPAASPELIALLRQFCQAFIFPGIGGSQQMQIANFLDWYSQQKEWLNCNAAFSVDPKTRTVTMVVSISSEEPASVSKN